MFKPNRPNLNLLNNHNKLFLNNKFIRLNNKVLHNGSNKKLSKVLNNLPSNKYKKLLIIHFLLRPNLFKYLISLYPNKANNKFSLNQKKMNRSKRFIRITIILKTEILFILMNRLRTKINKSILNRYLLITFIPNSSNSQSILHNSLFNKKE